MSFFQTLPQFKILASTAKYLERVFVGVFTATRFLAILTAGILNPAVGIFISLFIIFVGSLVLVFTQQISAAAVWAGVILQAVNTFTRFQTYFLVHIQFHVCDSSNSLGGKTSNFLSLMYLMAVRIVEFSNGG